MNKKIFTISGVIGILAILTVVGFGCSSSSEVVITDDNGEVIVDRDAILLDAKESGLIMDDEEMSQMTQTSVQEADSQDIDPGSYLDKDFSDWPAAALADVTGGGSYGMAHNQFLNGEYILVAEFGNLPVPGAGYFYEGWIVRRGSDMSVVSTGALEIVEDTYVNVFVSSVDYSDHDFYVLTLEPDNGNPAPDEHILEGTFK